jgi:hypothetical protein
MVEGLAQDGLASAPRTSRSMEVPGRAVHRGEEDSAKNPQWRDRWVCSDLLHVRG